MGAVGGGWFHRDHFQSVTRKEIECQRIIVCPMLDPCWDTLDDDDNYHYDDDNDDDNDYEMDIADF